MTRRGAKDGGPEYIAAGLRALAVEIDSLTLDPANARRHTPRNLQAIGDSLAEFGQAVPVVIDPDGRVIVGNGTVTAARKLGWRQIAAVRTDLKGRQAAALAIAMNRSAELAEWDESALAAQLDALAKEAPELLAATGFDAGEMDRLLADLTDGDADTAGIRDVAIRPPPSVVWVLLAIPVELFVDAREPLAALEQLSAVTVETTR